MKTVFSLVVKGHTFQAAVYFTEGIHLKEIELFKEEQHVQYIYQNAFTGRYYAGDDCKLLPGCFKDVCLVLDQQIRYIRAFGLKDGE